MTGPREHVDCALCGADRSLRWLRASDVEFGGAEVFEIVECRACSLRYLDPRPTPEAIGTHYPASYYTHSAVPIEELARIHAHPLRLVHRFGGHGRVLDIGAGDGGFLALLRHEGWPEGFGIEADEAAWSVATGQRGLDVAHGRFPETRPPEGAFALVSMLEVIEHLHDPLDALRIVRDLLAPGGRLVLTTPNVAGLEFLVLRGRNVSLQVPRHLYFFTAETMVEMLERAGLAPLHIHTSDETQAITRSLWLALRRPRPGGDVARAIAGEEAEKGHADRSSWRRRAHRAVDLALRPAGMTLSRLGLGPGLHVVAERPG